MRASEVNPLPEFANPPVAEVVFAVAIEPLTVSVVDLSVFAVNAFGEDLPVRSELPPMRMTHESFDPPLAQLGHSLALLAGQPPLRLWFQSADQSRLVQLQRDWIACNWQKSGGSGAYPRYKTIEGFFLDSWDKMSYFAAQRTGRPASPVQCELSYLNQIRPGHLWERPGQISEVLALAGTARDFLPEAEDGQLLFRYRMRHEGRDVGRLYVQAVPMLNAADTTATIQLNMIARGAPIGPGRDGMLTFLRLAHEWIVRGFAAVTTEAAQDSLWGRSR